MIIGVTGNIGSGKDVVSKYLVKNYNYKFVSIGDIVRSELKRRKLPITRTNSGKLQKQLTTKYGADYWIQRAVKKIKTCKWKDVAISGIRYPLDVETFRKEFGTKFRLIKVEATPKVRFERLKSRKRPGYPKTYDIFKEQDKNETKMFNFRKTFSYSNYSIQNNTTLESVYEQVDKLIRRIKHKKK